jgi:hypothetical protein
VGGWVRASSEGRDATFLWLTDTAEARPIAEISESLGFGEHALREALRRDTRFTQLRPEGTWALTDWKTAKTTRNYDNAEQAVVEVLRDLGPLTLAQLTAETIKRYPVSTWRIAQCVSSSNVGRTPLGLYDLAERGALPIEESEPRRPDNVVESGNIIGLRLPVSYDLLRGSGLAVNRWLTWRLGLRQAPSSKRFTLVELDGEIVVRRTTSTSSISTLRSAVASLGLVEGCQVAVLLRLNSATADVRHACSPGNCPTRPLPGPRRTD